MRQRRMPGIAAMAIAMTVLGAPLVAAGWSSLFDPATSIPFLAVLTLTAAVLRLFPAKVRADVEVSPADVAVLAAVVFTPLGAPALVAAVARGVALVRWPRAPWVAVYDVASGAATAGLASLMFHAVVTELGGPFGRAVTIPAAAAAALTFLALELVQVSLRQAALGRLEGGLRGIERLLGVTGRAMFLWLFGAAIVLELVRVEPLFLIPGVPLFALGYRDIVARVSAERRVALLETAVGVSHAVGSSLDPTEVFRQVFRQVRSVLPVDAFFVAMANEQRDRLFYRFLVDESRELEPTERDLEGTLAGQAIRTGEPILLRDAEHDRERLGIPRVAWGTVEERSILVAPLRIRGEVRGAISAQSVQIDAYDSEDLDLIENIAREAAIAIERAELHERTARLSQRLFDLHRLGVELVAQRDVGALSRRLSSSVGEMLHGRAAVYLDTGGDTLVLADQVGPPSPDRPQSISKRGTATEQAMRTGRPIEVASSAELPEASRHLMDGHGLRSSIIHPLRAADQTVGVLYVGWQEEHRLNDEERELVGLIAGIGATALRSLRLYSELEDAYLSTVTTLTATIQAREGYREDHFRRVAADAVALGQRLGLPDDALRVLRYAALFHSIGKIAVPGWILGKTGPLTPEERTLVQEHPVLGAQIIGSIHFLRDVAPIVRHANERWDGEGYPDRLKGEAIPRLARILAVAIAYHAMRVDRPYRPAMPIDAAITQLRRSAGDSYDPLLVEEFVKMVEVRGAIAQAEQELAGARELAILSELTPEFHTLLDLQQLLERVLGMLEKRMPGTRLAIMLEDPTSGELVLRATAGSWSASAQRRLPRGRGIAGWVIEHAKAQIVDDVRHDPRWVGTGDDTRSALIVPLLAGGRPIGVIGLLHPGVGAFGQRDLTLMQAVGAQLAAAIEVAELHERLKVAASTDGLTGIHNYRYFWDRLEEEVSRAERRGTQLSIAYFDIDGLKAVNDRYGHLAGDAVLRTLGRLIGGHVRHEDVPARYGGDEFAIVMPETPHDEAENAVGRLMALIDRSQVELDDGETITMPSRSWGVATYPTDGRTAKDLVERADTRAYGHKRR
ncbi:MAG: GAF domain-containing protein [Chloroflexi bacterium]|nr:GAF domain-containing protein [Chloroflexota bacterium]